ncbi:MAG: peptide-methionine (S)-S-oxide reductase MsrA [Clostridia bacterium]|nr:peptide-methionine (S)-S-oxide reductase MsrA [Clostridia bacterium]
MSEQNAYFAGGCFWCVAPIFRIRPGVLRVVSGYCGGAERNPTYGEVKAQKTGHRETVRVTYEEEKISFEELLDVFLAGVDPYDGEGQYIDRGRSYTLAVYPVDGRQEAAAKRAIAALQKKTGRRIFVSVEPFVSFFAAEEEHQDYDKKNPEAFLRELEESGRIAPREKPSERSKS